ncbi:MAG: hypothetical protein JW784_00495, partial [Candidatus Cloacimonetes bacterium]|nr:hypothetical protein [Candidatus Cloacimonadota bacterium]
MKRALLLFVMSIFIIPLVGMVEEEIIINDNDFSLELISSTDQETIIEYSLGNFFRTPVEIDGETYYQLRLAKEANTFDKGEPELPKITRSIIIPDNALMAVQIIESEYVEYAMKIIPSKGLLSRSVNPEDVPYEFGEVYLDDSFYPELRAELGNPYIMRDFRGVTVNAYPFSYNPQTEILRVYTYIVLKVENIGLDTRNVKERTDNRVNRYFREIYSNHFLNFQQTRYDTIEEQGRIIVISYGNFMDAMQPYVDWKIQKGIQCDMYDVADIGTSSAIYTFIQDEYELNDGLTFVLLVGDAAQVQPRNTDEDPTYGLMEGGDNYPEIFISRFSAENVAQVETQVERTIHYERDIDEGEWLHKGCGIASAQGVGDDGEYDNEHIDNIRDKLMNYTYTEV